MAEPNNISRLHHCYGCGVCVKACPEGIISLREDADGFYAPVIKDEDRCTGCGLCLRVCSFNHEDVASPCNGESALAPDGYAAWSTDVNVRQWCSSGGVGYEIGRRLLLDGYKAVGVKYDIASRRAEHFVAATTEEFAPSVGSKYIPSRTVDALSEIDFRGKYLVTGTPCQIDSLRRLLRVRRCEERFVLLDFFCHGVPSLLAWDGYLDYVRARFGTPGFVSWRNKRTGWQDSWAMNFDSRDSATAGYDLSAPEPAHEFASRMSEGDLFYKLFLGNYCLNKCCYENCKFKMLRSAADIRIGDLWGDRYSTDSKGVSALICLSQTGRRVVESLGDRVTLVPEPVKVVTEGQMRKPAHRPGAYAKVMAALRAGIGVDVVVNKVIKHHNIRYIPQRLCNKMLKRFHLPLLKY